MLRSSKWWIGFIPGMLLLLWSAVFWFVLTHLLDLGPGLLLLFITAGILVIMTLLMLLLVFSKKTRLISFGLAWPLLVLHAGVFILNLPDFRNWLPIVWVPGMLALIVVFTYFFIRHRSNDGLLTPSE